MSKKLCFFLFYLPLDIKDLLSLGLKGLILSELYIPSSPGFKEFSLNYLC
jgi:membrane-anchored glycerophosphoryl diester phosphodiesterase (GDPDase)